MQIQGRRGRACQPCRRRKIKCGEQTPMCQQCITAKIECSGPVTGPLIVEVNPQRGPRRYRQGAIGKDKGELTREHASQMTPARHLREGSLSDPGSPSLDTVPDRLVLINTLASKFQECIWIPHQRHESVVSHLLDFVRSDDLPMLQRSIGAVSLAMTGVATENWALVHEGQKLYGATLKALIRGITRNNEQGVIASRTQQPEPVSLEIMALSVVCVWYEVISSSTNRSGWSEHSWGVGRLILTRPPENYTAGLAHAVFRTARYMVVRLFKVMLQANASLATIIPTPLALEQWLRVPFSSSSKEPFDRIVDFMLVIPVCLNLVDQLCAAEGPTPASLDVETLQQKVEQLDQQLDIWCAEYQEEFKKRAQNVYIDIEDDFEDPYGIYHPAKRRFVSDAACECIAHYATSRLVVALMLTNLASPPDRDVFRAQALNYSALALSAAAFADAQSTTRGIRELFGMIILHVVIFCATPSRSHQAYTKRRIDSWDDPRGYRGICGAEEALIERWRNLVAVWGNLGSGGSGLLLRTISASS